MSRLEFDLALLGPHEVITEEKLTRESNKLKVLFFSLTFLSSGNESGNTWYKRNLLTVLEGIAFAMKPVGGYGASLSLFMIPDHEIFSPIISIS